MSLQSDINSLVVSVDLILYDTSVVTENEETIYRVSVVSPEFTDGKRVGVSLDKCVELTHLISPLLDVTPPISGEYRLEVGSPGIERKLTTLEHFKMSIGERISLQLNNKEKIRSLLKSVEGSSVVLEIDGNEEKVNFADILKAKTYFEW